MINKILKMVFLVLYAPCVFALDSLRIDAQELDGLMKENRVVVIDARPAAEYRQGHLPGARSLPFTSTFNDMKQSGRVLSLANAQTLFGKAGLNQDDLIVVYDAGILLQASRLLWTLEVYGHKKVKLLDGGLKAWQQANLPISQEAVQYAPSSYVPSVDPKRLATRLSTLAASRKPASYVIVDARATPHYQGWESEASRFGHIPEAKGIAISENLTADGTRLKSREELLKLYGNIPKNKKIITYCSVGLASSLEYMVLRELGYDVANYDASWKEWGNDPSLPIVDPAKGGAKHL